MKTGRDCLATATAAGLSPGKLRPMLVLLELPGLFWDVAAWASYVGQHRSWHTSTV
jgi:hypothetical protein